jgi:hypothetical protein
MKAALVFLCFLFLAVQASTGFMRLIFDGDYYPRAMRPLDWMLQAGFIGPFGKVGGSIILVGLGLVLAAIVLRHERLNRNG